MAEAISSADSSSNETGKSDPLTLLLSAVAAILWGLVVYGLLVKVPDYQMAFLGREEVVPGAARWLVAMSEPWIVLLFTVGIYALILGSFHYRNKPLGLVMVILGAFSIYWSLTTLEEAKDAAAQAPVPSGGRTPLSSSALESKMNGSGLLVDPPKAPAPAAPIPPAPPLKAAPPPPQTPAQAPAVKPVPAPPPPPSLARPPENPR